MSSVVALPQAGVRTAEVRDLVRRENAFLDQHGTAAYLWAFHGIRWKPRSMFSTAADNAGTVAAGDSLPQTQAMEKAKARAAPGKFSGVKVPTASNQAALKAAMAAERTRLLLTGFDKLPDALELNRAEVSVLVNRSVSTLKKWQAQSGHPLVWRRRGKQLCTTVGDVRAFQRSAFGARVQRADGRAAI
jgi:hypothetical protein